MKKLLLITLISLFPYALSAQENYTIQNITIEKEGELPEKLRKEALTDAKTKAFEQLLQQMTTPDSWSKHPWIIANENISRYIQKVSIVDEQNADGYYSVTINATFDAPRVRKMLLKNNISFTEPTYKKITLFPIFVENGQVFNSADNEWLLTLQKMTQAHEGQQELSLTFLQETNLEDAEKTDVNDLLNHPERLKSLSLKIDAPIALSVAEVKHADTGSILSVKTFFSQDEDTLPISFSTPITANTRQNVLLNSAKRLKTFLGEELLQKEVISADEERVLFIRFKAENVEDIERMEKELEKLSVVSDVSPRLISVAESVFMVHIYSDIPAFLRTAERENLILTKQGSLYEVQFK